MTDENKNKPIKKIGFGASKITVWNNKSLIKAKDGTEIEKEYKTYLVEKVFKKDDNWDSTNSFTRNELFQLRAVIDKVLIEEAIEYEDKKQ